MRGEIPLFASDLVHGYNGGYRGSGKAVYLPGAADGVDEVGGVRRGFHPVGGCGGGKEGGGEEGAKGEGEVVRGGEEACVGGGEGGVWRGGRCVGEGVGSGGWCEERRS